MICKECGSKMRLDDKDYNFKGNYDNYWICDECGISCCESVRFGQVFRESWGSESKEYVITYKIERGTRR